MNPEDFFKTLCDYKGIYNPCKACHGLGGRSYSNTSTWRGGIGGNMFSKDVCDKCWGSGDADRPWTDIRKLEQAHSEWEEEQCLKYLAQRSGATLSRIKNRFLQLADMCAKESRRRKLPDGESPFWWSMEWDMFSSIFKKFGS